MVVLLSIISIVFGILQIILFFKIWGMTNDVRELKLFFINKDSYTKIISEKRNTNGSADDEKKENGFSPNPNRKLSKGNSVINISNGEQMIINEIGYDGSCICYIGKKMVGIFQPNEIATIEEYSNYKK